MKPIDTLNDLMTFCEWAKKNGAHKLKVGGIEVEFGSGYSGVPPTTISSGAGAPPDEEDGQSEEVEEEVLFHSAPG